MDRTGAVEKAFSAMRGVTEAAPPGSLERLRQYAEAAVDALADYRQVAGKSDVTVSNCHRVVVSNCSEIVVLNSYGQAWSCRLEVASCDLRSWAFKGRVPTHDTILSEAFKEADEDLRAGRTVSLKDLGPCDTDDTQT